VARPKSFDPETVLAKAMDVFWEKGYEAASISDLTAAMGINRFSLYDTFGDKHTLYLKAMDSYSEKVVGPHVERVRAIDSLDALEAYFSMVIDYQHACEQSKCCMIHMAATSLAMTDEAARAMVVESRNQVQKAYRDMLQQIKNKGELRDGIDLNDAAWLLSMAQSGLVSYSTSPIPAESSKGAFRMLIDQLRA